MSDCCNNLQQTGTQANGGPMVDSCESQLHDTKQDGPVDEGSSPKVTTEQVHDIVWRLYGMKVNIIFSSICVVQQSVGKL